MTVTSQAAAMFYLTVFVAFVVFHSTKQYNLVQKKDSLVLSHIWAMLANSKKRTSAAVCGKPHAAQSGNTTQK